LNLTPARNVRLSELSAGFDPGRSGRSFRGTKRAATDQSQKRFQGFHTDEVETHALAGIELNVRKGEYISISGPSGCGKSTLLAILGLLDTPSDGSYVLNDTRVDQMKLSQRARVRNREIGFIFQAFNLIGDLTVYENVELPLTYRNMPATERKNW
jgi:putative ABC transport system ATP-binding protein